MKKYTKWLLGLIFVMMLAMVPAKSADAATVKNKLFDVTINDGWNAITIPVYENVSGSSRKLAVGKSSATLYAGAKTAKLSITGKTDYYKSNFYSVSYPQGVKLSASKKVSIILKTTAKKKKTVSFKLVRPAMPKMSKTTVSAKTLTVGKTKIKGTATATSKVTINTFMQVENSAGKVVYKTAAKSGKKVKRSYEWSGKASANNNAGLQSGSYVPAGKYKVTVYLEYTVNGKSKYLGTSAYVTVENSAAEQTASTVSTNVSANVSSTDSWPWIMMVTGDDDVDYMAEVICRSVLKPNMTEIQRARALFGWFNKNFIYKNGCNLKASSVFYTVPVRLSYETADAKAKIAAYGKEVDQLLASGKARVNNDDAFSKVKSSNVSKRIKMVKMSLSRWVGDCHHISLDYEVLLRHAGINCDILENSSPLTKGYEPPHHYWNMVMIGGKYYMADARGCVPRSGTMALNYDKFLRGTNYTDKVPMYHNVRTVGTTAYSSMSKYMTNQDCPGRLN